jgi:hypothetical protein
VRNVLVIVAIRQKDPLKNFNTEHFVQVVKSAKDLLSSLYDKVIQSKDSIKNMHEEVMYEPLQLKEYNIPIEFCEAKEKKNENVNYVGQKYVRKMLKYPNKKEKV